MGGGGRRAGRGGRWGLKEVLIKGGERKKTCGVMRGTGGRGRGEGDRRVVGVVRGNGEKRGKWLGRPMLGDIWGKKYR